MSERTNIERLELADGDIKVTWQDGHASDYDAKYLRINCGCAECVEEWSQRQLLNPASVPSDLRAEDHLMVGRYAVQFLWSDAHFTGIYPFDLLRRLCPCEECKATNKKDS